eukprot:7310123-Pyramimonas_sp.AAC.1
MAMVTSILRVTSLAHVKTTTSDTFFIVYALWNMKVAQRTIWLICWSRGAVQSSAGAAQLAHCKASAKKANN